MNAVTEDRSYAPSGFFAFRTPLLPWEELEAWSEGLAAAAAGDGELHDAVATDRERLRERLEELLGRPEIREAIYVASPTLWQEGVTTWRRSPDSKDGLRAERALVRYVARMASRPTPFGLFSASSLGRIGGDEAATRIRLVGRSGYGRHTRLDMDYLFALVEDLERDENLVSRLRYRPSDSLYRAGGRLRYAEGRLDGKLRSYHLVAVEPADYLLRTLERARGGSTLDELAAALVAEDDDVEPEEAEEFVRELVAGQILVADLKPLVTGGDALEELAARLAEQPAAREAAEHLRRARERLRAFDEARLGNPPERYRELVKLLEESLPTKVEPSRVVQVDMVKPAEEAVLGPEVLTEIERGVEILRRLTGPLVQESLDRFKQSFNERYGERREVPLVEVLDEEIGIGFERSGGAFAEASPLLAGLAFPPPAGGEGRVPWGARDVFLLRRVQQAVAAGEREIDLGDDDLDILARGRGGGEGPLPPLPDAFHVMAEVAAESAEAIAAGDFRVHLVHAAGPSGARLLARFCHLDGDLEEGVRRHLEQEEALRPEAVFAEVVHLPQGRIGNILARPALRDWEIPYLGRSAVDEEHRLPVTDLRVSVVNGRIVLTSARLGREVVPRLTTAHNFLARSLGTYRFLCALQSQGVQGGVTWSWGALEAAPFLPRMTAGRLVLSRARWRLDGGQIERLTKPLSKKGAGGAKTVAAARALRAETGLPRWVALVEGDNELVVDLENVLSLEAALDVLDGRVEATFSELFPPPDELFVEGPEGRFVQEVLVPFVSTRPATAGRPATAASRPRVQVRESFPPGSEWLYAKLYTGTSTADAVLRDVVLPVVREARAAFDHWYFIRYADPDWHVRVRFHGEPEALHREVLPRLHRAAAPFLDDGRLWALRLDTYQRETARYGGPEGIALAERLFAADSEAVLGIVATLEGDEGTEARWRLALLGAHRLLEDLGLELEGRSRVATRLRESWSREFRAHLRLKRQLGDRHRQERQALDALLGRSPEAEALYGPGFAAFDRRSETVGPVVAELRSREQAGGLDTTVEAMAPSYLHMHVNRMIRAEARAHELVLYEMLHRHYHAEIGRARARAKGRASENAKRGG